MVRRGLGAARTRTQFGDAELLHHVLVIGSSGILRIGLTCALLAQQGHACDDRENEQDNTGEEFRKPVSHVVSLLVPAIELRSLAYCRRGNAQNLLPWAHPGG